MQRNYCSLYIIQRNYSSLYIIIQGNYSSLYIILYITIERNYCSLSNSLYIIIQRNYSSLYIRPNSKWYLLSVYVHQCRLRHAICTNAGCDHLRDELMQVVTSCNVHECTGVRFSHITLFIKFE